MSLQRKFYPLRFGRLFILIRVIISWEKGRSKSSSSLSVYIYVQIMCLNVKFLFFTDSYRLHDFSLHLILNSNPSLVTVNLGMTKVTNLRPVGQTLACQDILNAFRNNDPDNFNLFFYPHEYIFFHNAMEII